MERGCSELASVARHGCVPAAHFRFARPDDCSSTMSIRLNFRIACYPLKIASAITARVGGNRHDYLPRKKASICSRRGAGYSIGKMATVFERHWRAPGIACVMCSAAKGKKSWSPVITSAHRDPSNTRAALHALPTNITQRNGANSSQTEQIPARRTTLARRSAQPAQGT